MASGHQNIDPISQEQAKVLIGELERLADSIVASLEKTPGADPRAARSELYAVRDHVRRLEVAYALT